MEHAGDAEGGDIRNYNNNNVSKEKSTGQHYPTTRIFHRCKQRAYQPAQLRFGYMLRIRP